MKLNLYETHDRFQHFTKQSFSISECCQDLINQRPFGEHPFYIFAHARTADDGVNKRLLWQPRLTKPKAQTNSMLFKVYPGSDNIKVIWMIPDRELWKQYEKGLVTENQTVCDSIRDFQYNRQELERKEPDDLSDIQINAIYREVSQSAKAKLYNRQELERNSLMDNDLIPEEDSYSLDELIEILQEIKKNGDGVLNIPKAFYCLWGLKSNGTKTYAKAQT